MGQIVYYLDLKYMLGRILNLDVVEIGLAIIITNGVFEIIIIIFDIFFF